MAKMYTFPPKAEPAREEKHLTVSDTLLEESRIVDRLMRDWEDSWRDKMMLYWALACGALYMISYCYPSLLVTMAGGAASFCGLIFYHTRGPSPPQWLKDARRAGFKSSVSRKNTDP